ncbi:MAG TPA: hypothetical protein VEZ14_02750 [Dehalococcoidia bacterium]|nr:hypothetical protein [Dehalococcoidia bacterium]
MAFFLTRLNVGDYDAWKPMFDEDGPGARRSGVGHRIFRNADNAAEVYILVEFATADEARDGRAKLLASGVLDRFADKTDPVIIEEAEAVRY